MGQALQNYNYISGEVSEEWKCNLMLEMIDYMYGLHQCGSGNEVVKQCMPYHTCQAFT